MITQSYKLNIVPYAEQTVRGMTSPKVPVSQYDKGLRTLAFDLYDGANGRLTLLAGQTAKIYGKKPDANVFEYDMTISEDKQSVSIVLQEQMAVIAGCVECEVRIFQGAATIGSANFTLIVEPAPVGADEVYSESEIPEIDNLLYGGTAGQVFTKTPTGAHWADLGTSSDFMLKSVYDPNDDGSVLKADHADDADTVDGHTVARNVLADEYTNAQIDGMMQAAGTVKTVNSVQPDQNGNVQIGKSDIGLGNVDNTSDASKPISTATQAALDDKVDKVAGKGLSTNDFTTAEKEKLAGIAAGAEVNVQANWNEADTTSDAYIQNKPSIPSKTSDLTNDSGFITGVSWGAIGGTLADQIDLNNELSALNTGLTSVNSKVDDLAETVLNAPSTDWGIIQKQVEAGLAAELYPVGTQFTVHHDVYGDMLFDVIGHDHDLPIGQEHSMTLLMHHVIYGTQIGAEQALYYAEEAMPAGTYVFQISSTWSQALAGYYKFTTSQEIPAGGQVGPIVSIADNVPSTWKVNTYASQDTTTALESNIVISTATDEQEGTFLGNITSPTGNLNHINRIGYGSNDWEESGVRQWLNADVETDWFEPKTIFDRPISYASRPGFLFGFGADFKAVLAETTHGNRSNTVFDSHGTNQAYSTIEKVFLLCNEECGLAQEQGIVCGTLYDYYKDATDTDRIKYDITSQSTARNWWLRSPDPSDANRERIVNTGGALNRNNARGGNGFAAACVIAGNGNTSRSVIGLINDNKSAITALSESVAPIETSPATQTHATGTYIMYQNRLYKVIASIAVGETLTVGTNIQATTIMEELLALTA